MMLKQEAARLACLQPCEFAVPHPEHKLELAGRLTAFLCLLCRTVAWDVAKVLAEAGDLPSMNIAQHNNQCLELEDHMCSLTALTVSACGSMMATADASGTLVVRFSVQTK